MDDAKDPPDDLEPSPAPQLFDDAGEVAVDAVATRTESADEPMPEPLRPSGAPVILAGTELDRPGANQVRPLLPERLQLGRGAAALLRDQVLDGRGQQQLLRAAEQVQLRTLGRADARGLQLQREGVLNRPGFLGGRLVQVKPVSRPVR